LAENNHSLCFTAEFALNIYVNHIKSKTISACSLLHKFSDKYVVGIFIELVSYLDSYIVK